MIAIVDYGLGNLGSISNMLKKTGEDNIVLADTPDKLAAADRLILPGVGAFDSGMKMLNESGLRQELDMQVRGNHKPILGICLGMQMLGLSSEEGNEKGLGYISFSCRRFFFENKKLQVPHMGWDIVNVENSSPLVLNQKEFLKFYFVHSYYAVCDNDEDVLLSCEYGIKFTAAVHRDNVYGVQFHPEKSHNYGKWILQNFVKET